LSAFRTRASSNGGAVVLNCRNSVCHFFGHRRFATGDESRNLAWMAPITFGEAWHNNHHAFPTSARHGLGRRQLDPGAWLISALERCHLAWDVVRISPGRQQSKAAVGTGHG
jgi:stearoyl-CoA desaturase (delta-9 desaturase)